MIPLRDDIRSRSYPMMTAALIALNSLVFLYELSLPPAVLSRFVNSFGMTPARLHLDAPLTLLRDPSLLIVLLSSAFLHSGWLHFLSNMWVLGVFGNNVEDRMGHSRFLSFYTLAALVANLLQALVYPHSRIPAIGASGAIAGVLGSYFLFFPRARVLTLIPIFFIPWLVRVRAIVFLGFWFVSQLYSGLFSLRVPSGTMGGVAWWAHIGGFLFGVLAAKAFDQGPPVQAGPEVEQFYNPKDRDGGGDAA